MWLWTDHLCPGSASVDFRHVIAILISFFVFKSLHSSLHLPIVFLIVHLTVGMSAAGSFATSAYSATSAV